MADLLVINEATPGWEGNLGILGTLKRGGSDAIDIDGSYGDARASLKLALTDRLKAGKTYRGAVFSTHGNSGIIGFGQFIINYYELYAGFYNHGLDALFLPSSKILFSGCNVADGEDGWRFLEAAARTFLGRGGGFAIGWTSKGFGIPSHASILGGVFWLPFEGHTVHFWGNVRKVEVSAGGDYLNYYDDGNLLPDRPISAR